MVEGRAGGAAADAEGPLVFVEDLAAPVLTDDDHHHLARVRRVRVGDPVVLADGRGRWCPARFGAEPEPAGSVVTEARPGPALTVGFAPVKGQRPEWAVQKLTEIGVDAVWLLIAERSVVRWEGERAEGHRHRLAKVAREAAMQCRRPHLPEIVVGRPVAEAIAAPGAALAERGGAPVGLDRPTVLVGPEGGWTAGERALGSAEVGLGPTVLRAETAAVSAGLLLSALRAGIVAPSGPPT